MPSEGEIVRFADTAAVQPPLRGHYAKVVHTDRAGRYFLKVYTWTHYVALVTLERDLLRPVTADEAARLLWAHTSREMIPELAAPAAVLKTAVQQMQDALAAIFAVPIGIHLWTSHSHESAASYAQYLIKGGKRETRPTSEEMTRLQEVWDTFRVAQDEVARAAVRYIDAAF